MKRELLVLSAGLALAVAGGMSGCGGSEERRAGGESSADAAPDVAVIEVGDAPSSVAVGAGAVWVANFNDDDVVRVDPLSGKATAKIPVGNGPFSVAVGEGAVWVANQFDDAVVRIDPGTNRVGKSIPVGDRPVAVAVGEGAVWVFNSIAGTVARIDPPLTLKPNFS